MTLGTWAEGVIVASVWLGWMWVVGSIVVDIVLADDLSGRGKAGWITLVVLLGPVGVLAHVVARGPRLTTRGASTSSGGTRSCTRRVASEGGAHTHEEVSR